MNEALQNQIIETSLAAEASYAAEKAGFFDPYTDTPNSAYLDKVKDLIATAKQQHISLGLLTEMVVSLGQRELT